MKQHSFSHCPPQHQMAPNQEVAPQREGCIRHWTLTDSHGTHCTLLAHFHICFLPTLQGPQSQGRVLLFLWGNFIWWLWAKAWQSSDSSGVPRNGWMAFGLDSTWKNLRFYVWKMRKHPLHRMVERLKEIDMKTEWLVISCCCYSSQSPAHSAGPACSKDLIYEVQLISLENPGDSSLIWAGHLESLPDFSDMQEAQRYFWVH